MTQRTPSDFETGDVAPLQIMNTENITKGDEGMIKVNCN